MTNKFKPEAAALCAIIDGDWKIIIRENSILPDWIKQDLQLDKNVAQNDNPIILPVKIKVDKNNIFHYIEVDNVAYFLEVGQDVSEIIGVEKVC